MQFSYRARERHLPFDEYASLLEIAKEEDRTRAVLAEHLEGLEERKQWAACTRLAYNTGIVLLLAGVAVALIPPGGLCAASGLRLAAAAVAAVGALLEFLLSTPTAIADLGAVRRMLSRRSRS